jgi:hypothetical protein
VHGTVNPNLRPATWRFQFGPTTAYGSSTPAHTTTVPTAVAAPITGLAPGTTVHYRLVGTNADGTAVGADRAFTTPTTPLPPFAGVLLRKQTVKVRKGVARIKVTCPVSAIGRCLGKLTLTKGKRKLGSRSFSIAAGRTARVRVKLSKAARRTLKRKHRLKAIATARAHDSRGGGNRRKSARVTLRT